MVKIILKKINLFLSCEENMSYLTYRQLIEQFKYFSEDQLDQTVTIFDCNCNEYLPCTETTIVHDAEGILDENQIILIINADVE